MYFVFSSLFFLSFLLAHVNAFSFSLSGDTTECNNLSVTWSGGTAPFQLLLTPVFGTQRNISIPSIAFNNGQGSYSFELVFPQKKQFLVTMSDATGFGAGGTSNMLTVGASSGSQSCNTTDPGVAFDYQLNSALTQCRPYVISDYENAAQPVTIYGIIPSGTPFVLNPPSGPASFTWMANVAYGTSIVFIMEDSQGRPGGSSDVKIVGISDDSSCLDSSSPSSTAALPSSATASSMSSNSASTTSSAASESTTGASNGVSIGGIAGTVIGSLLFLAVIITLGLFFLRKKREGNSYSAGGEGGSGGAGVYGGRNNRIQSQLDLTSDSHNANVHPYGGLDANSTTAFTPGYDRHTQSNTAAPYDSNPFSDNLSSQYLPTTQYNESHYPPSQYDDRSPYAAGQYPPAVPTYPPPPRVNEPSTEENPFNPHPSSQTGSGTIEPFEQRSGNTSSRASMSTAQRKAAMAGSISYKPSRFILHTDLEDTIPSENEEEIVELPPQYTERRAPLKGLDPAINSTTTHPLSSPTQPSSHAPNSWQNPLPPGSILL